MTYKRWRESPKGVVSEQETESKQADYGTAMARLNSANAEVAADQGEVDRLNALEGFKKIIAPFDGVVTARETDIGALINAGSGTRNGPELFRMADVSKMRIFVQGRNSSRPELRRARRPSCICRNIPAGPSRQKRGAEPGGGR